MEPSFWHARWNSGRIGFHNDHTHPLLEQHWPRVAADLPSTVLVPLCGKSHDLTWLNHLGHFVIGVELSQRAAESFYSERQPTTATIGSFECWSDGGAAILVGDWFQLTEEDLRAACEAISAPLPTSVYDRAALVALPESMRQRYVESLQQLMGAVPWLLVTVEYDQTLRGGPPFTVDESAVRQLHADRRVERIDQIDSPLKDLVVQEAAYLSRPG